MKLVYLTLALLALPAFAAGFKEVTLPPADEASRVPSFAAFREELQKTVAEKDTAKLLSHVAPKIKFSFGDEDGKAPFIKEWKLDQQPEKSPLWKTLAEVLAGGAAYVANDELSAPYLFHKWPESFDAFEYQLVNGANVPVRKAPRANGALVKEVSYLIVKPGKEQGAWQEVELPSGEKGFVEQRYLRSPVGYRAYFHLENKRWMITTFIAGD